MTARVVMVALLALAPLACFQPPPFPGPYACAASDECGGGGLICSDGVCCHPTQAPLCLTYVFPDGSCADGGLAQDYFEDLDGDGYGNENVPRKYCAPPSYERASTVSGDCNDNPAAGGASVYPGATEQCDGEDNDCDGTRDEGFQLQSYFLDQDGDGDGDPSVSVMACAQPRGYVTNSLDCAPSNPRAHPGADELCNGIDDNCNGVTDEDVPGTGEACVDPTRKGVCVPGTLTCLSGALTCEPTVAPTPDHCDGLDNDCDGTTDEAPDCGGPPLFRGEETATFGVKRLQGTLGGFVTECVKDRAASTGAPDTFNPTTMTWKGVGPETHVLWAEHKGADYWDLTKPGTKLRLYLEVVSLLTSAPQAWDAHSQPVVMLCGPDGIMRLVYTDLPHLLVDQRAGYTVNKFVPPDPATGSALYPGWTAGSGSVPGGATREAFLRRVKRIEILIQPEGGDADFTLRLTNWGFP